MPGSPERLGVSHAPGGLCGPNVRVRGAPARGPPDADDPGPGRPLDSGP